MITGFGRTGNYWGSQTFDLKPDILVCAKMLSASYLPLAAVMVSEEIYQAVADGSDAIGTFGHGFNGGGHPVACAVALETLAIYDERDIIGHVRDVAPYFQSRLREAFAGHPLVGEVRGVARHRNRACARQGHQGAFRAFDGRRRPRRLPCPAPPDDQPGRGRHLVRVAAAHRHPDVVDEIVRRLSLSLEETAGSLEERERHGGPGRGPDRPVEGRRPESPANGPNNNLSDQ